MLLRSAAFQYLKRTLLVDALNFFVKFFSLSNIAPLGALWTPRGWARPFCPTRHCSVFPARRRTNCRRGASRRRLFVSVSYESTRTMRRTICIFPFFFSPSALIHFHAISSRCFFFFFLFCSCFSQDFFFCFSRRRTRRTREKAQSRPEGKLARRWPCFARASIGKSIETFALARPLCCVIQLLDLRAK